MSRITDEMMQRGIKMERNVHLKCMQPLFVCTGRQVLLQRQQKRLGLQKNVYAPPFKNLD